MCANVVLTINGQNDTVRPRPMNSTTMLGHKNATAIKPMSATEHYTPNWPVNR